MRIVKPYGNSATARDDDGKLTRRLFPNSFPHEPTDIIEFAKTHPKLVIAQWVSCLDKVLNHPHGGAKPNETQWALRNALGQQCWELIIAKGLLSAPEKRMKRLEREWWFRIHPHGTQTEPKTITSFRGRWYAAFAGEFDATSFDAQVVAERLYEHLYVSEYRISTGQRPKRQGLLASRAESVSRNVSVPIDGRHPFIRPWTQQDQDTYVGGGDVAARIFEALTEIHGQREARLRRCCADLLKKHVEAIGEEISAKEGAEQGPGLWALHAAVRQSYKSVLGTNQSHLLDKLPRTIQQLLLRVNARFQNQKVNALLKLGRVIHYEAAPDNQPDHISDVVEHWPKDISGSRYWTTEGQLQIKRNESFIRVWKGTLALASRTLTDWADPHRHIERDILGAREIRRAIDEIKGGDFDKKARLLFGTRAVIFESLEDETKRDVLTHALLALRDLRNNAYHFVGLRGFLTALKSLDSHASEAGNVAIVRLWREDRSKRDEKLLDILNSANVPDFATAEEIRCLGEGLRVPVQVANLPALRRVLDRASNAWTFDKFKLDLPATPRDQKNLALQSQFVAISLLYERHFAKWISELPATELRKYVERAETRTTVAARHLTQDDKVNARVTGRFKITDEDTIITYIRRVEGAMTADSRDGQNRRGRQRETSAFLDDLHCDVMAQALEAFLHSQGYEWLGRGFTQRRRSKGNPQPIPTVTTTQNPLTPNPWQVTLYFLLHLVPIDDISRLAQEIGRFTDWAGLEAEMLEELQEVLDLHRAMHDAKFVGAGIYFDPAELANFFEDEDSILEAVGHASNAANRAPQLTRGLRELLRFGDAQVLSTLCDDSLVTKAEIISFRSDRHSIEIAQDRRRAIHEGWGRSGKKIADDDLREYKVLVEQTAEFRHLSDDVTLVNHLRIHRLLIDVIAKLLDYAGQWERDLYLVTIALIYLEGLSPSQFFKERRGRLPVRTGQIIEALRNIHDDERANCIRSDLIRIFDLSGPEIRGENVSTRNDLAHFNCLHGESSSLDLTGLVNNVVHLMSYDRKRRNAVSKSIIDLLSRRNLKLVWQSANGTLTTPHVTGRRITHLGDSAISEGLVSDRYLSLARKLFPA